MADGGYEADSDEIRPSLFQEQRAALELAQLLANPVYYGLGVVRGDATPVMTVPGFMGSDAYLGVLRGWLRRIGYTPERSGVLIMAGSPYDLFSRILQRAEALTESHGRRIAIIGHSMGGSVARMLGSLRPDLVRTVVTLGAPLNDDPRRAAHPLVRAVAELILRDDSIPIALEGGLTTLLMHRLSRRVQGISIFSKEDAVIDWRACVDSDPGVRSFEVRGSHTGLAWNVDVYRILSATLAEPGSS
jgi:pimeloyl-ACP methyl ester carboxylesterase